MTISPPRLQQRSLLRLASRRLRRYFFRSRRPVPSHRIGVGMIGVGNVARWQHLPKLQNPHASFQLKAFYETEESRARSVAAEFSVPACRSLAELVQRDDIEAVLVCTPTQLHAEGVLAALRAKKHVLCEKPLAQCLEEAQQLWTTSRNAGLANLVNFSYRFRTDFAFVGQLIHAGVLGRIYHAWGSVSQGQWFTEKGEPSTQRADAAPWKFGPAGGVLRDMGPHVLDLVRWWFGEIRCVQAWLKPSPRDIAGADAACGLALTFDSGAMAQLLTSRLETGVKEQTFLDIAGSRGALRLENGVVKLWTLDAPHWRTLLLPPHVPDVLETFCQAISGSSVGPNFWDGLKNNEALEAAFLSAKQGTQVALPLEKDGHAAATSHPEIILEPDPAKTPRAGIAVVA